MTLHRAYAGLLRLYEAAGALQQPVGGGNGGGNGEAGAQQAQQAQRAEQAESSSSDEEMVAAQQRPSLEAVRAYKWRMNLSR